MISPELDEVDLLLCMNHAPEPVKDELFEALLARAAKLEEDRRHKP
jgi:hypothetical protein